MTTREQREFATSSVDDARREGRLVGKPVDLQANEVRVERVADDVGVVEARRRFGGVDLPASLVGMLAWRC